MTAVDSENGADFFMKLFHIIAVSLLAETAEAVEILPDLGGSQPHALGQFAGGNANYSVGLKLTENL